MGVDRTTSPVVALFPWGDVFHDFLDPLGITLEEFRDDFTGSWMFGYVAALAAAGVRTTVVCPTTKVRALRRETHAPTGAALVFVPAGRAFESIRARGLSGNRGARPLPSVLAAVAATHVAPYLGTPALAVARLLRRERSTAILCQEYETPRFDVLAGLGRALGVPVYATYQGGDRQYSRLERPIRPIALRLAAGLLIGVHSERARVRARYSLPPTRIHGIPNPVDLSVWNAVERDTARAALGLPAAARVAVWHGQVQIHRKGLDDLLAAWRLVRRQLPAADLRLVLVGDGEDRDELRRRSTAEGLEGVRLVDDWVEDRSRLVALLSAADVYVFPSRHEGMPVAPVEAMACGLPVVAADASGVKDVVGETGLVVPRDDPRALADALEALLGELERSRRLGVLARRRVEEEFALPIVGRRLRDVLVGGRG